MKRLMVLALAGLLAAVCLIASEADTDGSFSAPAVGQLISRAGNPDPEVLPYLSGNGFKQWSRAGDVLYVEACGQPGFGPATKPDPRWTMYLDSTLGPGNYDWYGPINDTGDGPTVDTMLGYDLVIWNTYDWWWTGPAYPSTTSLANMASYMDQGGKVWFIGQDAHWSTGTGMNAWLLSYFEVQSVTDDVINNASPITCTGENYLAGFSYSNASDFPSNNFYSDGITMTANGQTVTEASGYHINSIASDGSAAYWTNDLRTISPDATPIAIVDSMLKLFGIGGGSGPADTLVWDFEDGWQNWTHTGAAYPAGWGVRSATENGTTWVTPDHGDSSLWVDSDAAGSGVAIRDTAVSPVFTDIPGGWLYWGIAFNFIGTNERLYLIMRGHDGSSWGSWDTLYWYAPGTDVPSRWDSVDASAWLTFDSLQMGIYYSDSSSYAWYGVFDNIGPVVIPIPMIHDVASVGFISPAGTVAPSVQDIIGVVRNVGGYDETFNVHCVVTDLTDAVVLDTTVSATTLIGGYDTLDFGQVAMQDAQTYTMTMATLLAGDVNPANDTAVGTTVCTSVFWEVLPNMSVAIGAALVGWEWDGVTGNAIIHVFGGNPTAQQTIMNSFDYGTKTWSGPFTMPYPKHYGGCISYENKIYLLGGWTSPGFIMIYDCEGDTFHTDSVPLCYPVNDAMCALDEGRELIYIIGGGYSSSWTEVDSVQVFDINALTVNYGTNLPETRMAGSAAYLGNDTLYVACGRRGASYVATTLYGVIDPVTPTTITWTAGPDCVGGLRYRCGYADLGDALYLYGGYGTAYLNDCWRFRTSDGWVQMPNMFGPGRNAIGGCAAWADTSFTDMAEGLIFAAGGYTPYSTGFGCLHTNSFNYIEEVPGEISEVFTAKLVSSNIFRGELRVEFNLPMSSNVRFTVYDVTGRTITLDNYSNVGAGAHNLVWQGRDRNGDEVSAGTYFFRLEASESVFSGKIIVAE